ncbi:TPA: hypothetical protein DCX16_01460 [bacterium]|nr:hypothetical protein [bacterium]
MNFEEKLTSLLKENEVRAPSYFTESVILKIEMTQVKEVLLKIIKALSLRYCLMPFNIRCFGGIIRR